MNIEYLIIGLVALVGILIVFDIIKKGFKLIKLIILIILVAGTWYVLNKYNLTGQAVSVLNNIM